MIDLQLEKIQTDYCETCKGWLEFCFDRYSVTVEYVNISLSNIPLLRCDSCARYYLSEKTKEIILTFSKKAKDQGKLDVKVSPQQYIR